MENSYLIKGGKRLRGEVKLSGAKNIALKAIIAALLFDNEVILNNIPQIRDVFELIQLIQTLGGRAEFVEKNKVVVDGRTLNNNKVEFFQAGKIRVSFMLFAPLLHKFGVAFIPNPGGCRIGARPIDRVINGMKSLGIKVSYDSRSGYYKAVKDHSPKGSYRFTKSSHTGTELLILLSLFTKEQVVIENAALEPEIDELIDFLNQSGSKIIRDSTEITIKGTQKLKQVKPFKITADRNEAITYAVLALVTKGDITIVPIEEKFMAEFISKVKETGGGVEKLAHDKWRFFYKESLKPVNITTSPYPGFMTDWQPPWSVLMTQAQGSSVIHERVFENRFAYVEELKKLGAKISFCNHQVKDPKNYYYFNYNEKKSYNQYIRIIGPQKLHGGILTIADLRAGATLVLAALVVQGESIVNNASVLDRGYEDFAGKINSLGGLIRKI